MLGAYRSTPNSANGDKENKRTDPLRPITGRVIKLRVNMWLSILKIVRETPQFERRDNRNETHDQSIHPASGLQPTYVARREREVYLYDWFKNW